MLQRVWSWTALTVLISFAAGSVVRPLSSRSLILGQEFNGLTFIGETRQPRSRSLATLQPSLYFTNNVPDNWDGAKATCELVLGPDATLISFETAAEVAHIRDMLAKNKNPMQTFWTTGEFHSGRGEFIWAKGKPVDDGLNATEWDVGQPSEATDLTKLLMVNRGGEWYLQSRTKTEDHPYICEYRLGSATEPVPCYHVNDLIIAVDSSGSVGADQFYFAMQDFVKPLVKAWLVSEDSRVGLTIFSTDAWRVFHFNDTFTDDELMAKIDAVIYDAGWTNTHLALDLAYQDFKLDTKTVSRNLVLITDGASNNPHLTVQHALNLHRAKVRCFSIGIGNTNPQELLDIAENATQVFYKETYDDLKELLKPVSELVCYDHISG